MTAQIFCGLGTPKSQLYFDIQALIAKNGGRLKLAGILETELVKPFTPPRDHFRHDLVKYTRTEINFLKDNYYKMEAKAIAAHLERSLGSLRDKIWQLQKTGQLNYKIGHDI